MNDEQLLSLLANEIDHINNLHLNETLKKYTEGRLSKVEQEKLYQLAESNPELKIALQAYAPLDEEFITDVENTILENMVSDTEDTSTVNSEKKPSPLPTSSNQPKKRLNWFHWFQQNASWTLGSACAATIAFMTFSLVNTEHLAPQRSQDDALPNYTMEVSGGNTTFRGLEQQPQPEDEIRHEAQSTQALIRKPLLEIYPNNQLSITLRPSLSYSKQLQERLILINQDYRQELQGTVSKAPSGAIKILIKQPADSPWRTGRSQLVAVIAQQGFLPSDKDLDLFIDSGVRSFTSDNWILLSQPVEIKE